VCHPSYEIHEPIEVRILPDRVTVLSYPGPDRSIRDDDLKKYHFVARRYRNQRISEFLKELDMTEGRGTGIPEILRALEENDSPLPYFDTDADRTFFIAEFYIHPHFIREEQNTEQVTGQVLRLLKALAKNSLTRAQIQKILNI
jgi:ATP-dependent DNA helicase RecG